MKKLRIKINQWIADKQILNVKYIWQKVGRVMFRGRLHQYSEDDKMYLFYVYDSRSVLKINRNQVDNMESNVNRIIF
jgi:hypothetical protein